MRVLLISHTCQSRREGQPKAAQINRDLAIDLRLLVPHRWLEYDRWRGPEEVSSDAYTFQVGHVRWPWSGPGQWYLHHYPQMARILREFRPDIIDLWEEPWGLVSAHTAWLRNKILPNTKIISETEQNTAKNLPFPFEPFRSYTLRNAQYVVGRSEEAIRNVRALGYNGPAAVVPNAVDSHLFHPMDRVSCREQIGLKGFVVGYIGRLVEEKGLADLVESLKYCSDDVNVLFVGRGAYKEALQAQAESLGVAERVRFEGSVPLDKLPPYMNAIDTLVLPSRTIHRWKEQFGRVIIEAHACDTPVIGSSSGCIPEVVGEGGLIFDECDPKSLADAIMRMRGEPDGGRELGRIGRQQVEDKYTWSQVGNRMRAIYEELCPSASVPRLPDFVPAPSLQVPAEELVGAK